MNKADNDNEKSWELIKNHQIKRLRADLHAQCDVSAFQFSNFNKTKAIKLNRRASEVLFQFNRDDSGEKKIFKRSSSEAVIANRPNNNETAKAFNDALNGLRRSSRSELSKKNNEIDNLQKELTAFRKCSNADQQIIDSLQDELQEQYELLKNAKNKNQAIVKRTKSEFNKLISEKDALQQQIKSLATEIDELESTINELRQTQNEKEKDTHLIKEKNEKLTALINEMSAKMESKKDENLSLTKRLDSMQLKLSKDGEDKDRQIESLTMQIQEKEDKIHKKEIERLKNVISGQETKMNDLQRKYAAQRANEREKISNLARLHAMERNATKGIIKQLKDEIESSKNKSEQNEILANDETMSGRISSRDFKIDGLLLRLCEKNKEIADRDGIIYILEKQAMQQEKEINNLRQQNRRSCEEEE